MQIDTVDVKAISKHAAVQYDSTSSNLLLSFAKSRYTKETSRRPYRKWVPGTGCMLQYAIMYFIIYMYWSGMKL
jgi:hypothetical protein